MEVLVSLRVVVDKSGLWQMYRISRQAMRYGQYSIAEFIFSDLAYKVQLDRILWGTLCWFLPGFLLLFLGGGLFFPSLFAALCKH